MRISDVKEQCAQIGYHVVCQTAIVSICLSTLFALQNVKQNVLEQPEEFSATELGFMASLTAATLSFVAYKVWNNKPMESVDRVNSVAFKALKCLLVGALVFSTVWDKQINEVEGLPMSLLMAIASILPFFLLFEKPTGTTLKVNTGLFLAAAATGLIAASSFSHAASPISHTEPLLPLSISEGGAWKQLQDSWNHYVEPFCLRPSDETREIGYPWKLACIKKDGCFGYDADVTTPFWDQKRSWNYLTNISLPVKKGYWRSIDSFPGLKEEELRWGDGVRFMGVKPGFKAPIEFNITFEHYIYQNRNLSRFFFQGQGTETFPFSSLTQFKDCLTPEGKLWWESIRKLIHWGR